METIGAFQAKTQFSELLDRVEQGEEVTITRHGKPVARLLPSAGALDEASQRRAAIARIEALSREIAERNKGKPLVTQVDIRAWREEGRK